MCDDVCGLAVEGLLARKTVGPKPGVTRHSLQNKHKAQGQGQVQALTACAIYSVLQSLLVFYMDYIIQFKHIQHKEEA